MIEILWRVEKTLKQALGIIRLEVSVGDHSLGVEDLGHEAPMLTEAVTVRHRRKRIPSDPGVVSWYQFG